MLYYHLGIRVAIFSGYQAFKSLPICWVKNDIPLCVCFIKSEISYIYKWFCVL